MTVNIAELKNIYQSIPDDLPSELFQSLVCTDKIHIERIVSKGHQSPDSGWYDQKKNEWVMVLKGEAVLEFTSGKPVRLQSGDFVTIPAHCRHKVSWTRPDTETVWLAVHY